MVYLQKKGEFNVSKDDSQLKVIVNKIARNANTKIQEISSSVSTEEIIKQAIRIPGVKIDRSTFLRKELIEYVNIES